MTKTKKVNEVKKEIIARPVKKINPRGRIFEGVVIKKFSNRVVIQFERTVYVRKFERYKKSRTKLHARLTEEFSEKIMIGDLISIQECRPLSKTIHFIVTNKIKSGDQK
jgi:ribosomal protein S17